MTDTALTDANCDLAEIIWEAAAGITKESAIRAADGIIESFVLIPRADLPDFKVIDRKGEMHVDCGSDWGTWNVKHVARMKETALEYVGAWLTADQWVAEEEKAAKAHALYTRRNKLAEELTESREQNYEHVGDGLRRAIDRIIELEQAAS